MATLNFHVNDDTKAKLDWLAASRDDTYAGLIRSLIQEAFTKESKVYREDKAFLSWYEDNPQPEVDVNSVMNSYKNS